MSKSTGVCVAVLALAIIGAGCTGGRSTVSGLTLYQVCGGVPPPPGVDPCSRPEPVAATVIVQRGDVEVTRVRSDETGIFRVTLPAGTYTARATLDPGGPFVACRAVEVIVPTSTPLTLTCQLMAP